MLKYFSHTRFRIYNRRNFQFDSRFIPEYCHGRYQCVYQHPRYLYRHLFGWQQGCPLAEPLIHPSPFHPSPPVTGFSYTSPVCTTAGNQSPTLAGDFPWGTFSSTAGLSINSSTGSSILPQAHRVIYDHIRHCGNWLPAFRFKHGQHNH